MNLCSHYLSSVFLLLALPFAIEPFSVRNTSLDYLRGTLGYSYRCRNKETLNVAQNLSIYTFQLQVQPFGVTGKQFAAGNIYNQAYSLVDVKWNLLLLPHMSLSLSWGMPAGWRRHVDPHRSWSSSSRSCHHCAPGLPHRQKEEPRWLPNHLRQLVALTSTGGQSAMSHPQN